MTEDSGRIGIERDDHVAMITIDRPAKLNAVTGAMSAELYALIEQLDREDRIRVLVLTGAGERAFSAGSDIAELDRYATPWEFRNRVDYCDAVRASRKPVIAAVNGYALGGGLETALSCDIRIASRTATFAAPEVKLGWVGGGGMSALLTASVGPSRAATMLLTGDPVGADQALSWGLVSELTEPAELRSRARSLARTIAERPPIAVETAKANLRAAANLGQEEAMRYERDLQTVAFATEDAAEGRRAFAERRAATFHRR